MSTDPYQILSVSIDSTQDEIKQAYQILLEKHKNNPDKRKELDDAYRALQNTDSRNTLDNLKRMRATSSLYMSEINAIEKERYAAMNDDTRQWADHLNNESKTLQNINTALSPSKNIKAKIAFWVAVIGFVASVLGIISFYLDYMSH
jgi:DnaJ-class molecular chaperone